MAAMEWLSDEQQAAWRPFVALLLRLPAALDAELQKDAGITQFDYLVLSALSETPGRTLRMSELAATANSSMSRLSHVVSRLEAKGWVRRERSADDGRGSVAVLTAQGRRKIEEAAPGHVAEVRRLVFDGLDAEGVRRLAERARKSGRVARFQDKDREPVTWPWVPARQDRRSVAGW